MGLILLCMTNDYIGVFSGFGSGKFQGVTSWAWVVVDADER